MDAKNGRISTPAYLVASKFSPSELVIFGSDGRLLTIDLVTSKVTAPRLEAANEAGRVFVESIRHNLRSESAQLAAAMKGAVKVERGTGWVKVHGLDDTEALAELLDAARIGSGKCQVGPRKPPQLGRSL